MAKQSIDFEWNRRFIAGFIVAGFEAFAAVALLATSAYLISRASEQPPILYLMVAVVGVRAFALGRASARYLQRLITHDAVFRKLTEFRPVVFAKLAELVPGALSSRGRALETFTTDVERLQDYPLRVLTPILQALAALATMLAISIWIFPFAALPFAVVSLSFVLLILWLTSKVNSTLEAKRIQASQNLREELITFIGNIDVLVSYGWSAERLSRIQKQGNQILKIDSRRVLPGALAVALLGFGAVASAGVGGFFVGGSLEQVLPAVLAVAILMPLAVFDVFSQLQSVSAAWSGFKQARSRLQEIMNMAAPQELVVHAGDQVLEQLSGMRVENLSIARSGSSVISSLNYEFKKSAMTAIVGASGVGKSSLALVLASLLNPSSGKVLVGDAELCAYKLESRRQKIILIEQAPHVFRGTLRQNLEIAGESNDERMQSVLSLVGLDSEFEARGLLDTSLSEDAGNISGGQAQRIAIARGLLAGAEVLILDEPTSGLDRDNASGLLNLLRQLASTGITVILITHDSEIAKLCDSTLDLTEFAA